MSQEQGQNLGAGAFIYGHLFANFSAPKVDLTGRTALVTGGNGGLGYEAVLHFARCNASRIIIASRSASRCKAAAERVYKDVPTYRGKVDVLELDLSSFASVRSFCDAVNADKDRLDIVVANAGISKAAYSKTADGYESVLQVNGLSTALMGLLLLPKLEETAGMEVPQGSKAMKPTMSIVASEVHYWAKFPQQDATGSLINALSVPEGFIDAQERYNMSKLLSMFNGRELAKAPAVVSGKVIVNTVNPGLCYSALRDEAGPVLAWIFNAIAWTGEKGARNFLYSATQNTTPGAFIHHCKETPPSSFLVSAKGKASQEKYWKESLEIFRSLGVGEQVDKVLRA